MCEFVLSRDKDTLEVAEAMPIWSKNPFMRIKRNVKVPTIQLGQPDEVDEVEEEIPITKPPSSRKTAAKAD